MDEATDQRRAYLAALCRNVPSHIVERVLADPVPEAVGHDEFEGTVVYADLVGFTALCEKLDHAGKDALSRLSEILITFFGSVLDESFFPFGGNVVQFGGDSLTVAFRGADHEARAVAASLAACEIAGSINVARRSDSLRLRVGVASGMVRLFSIGDATQKGCVCGAELGKQAIDLQDRAEPGSVCVNAKTAEALAGRAELRQLDDNAFEVKGLSETPATIEVAGYGAGLDDRVEDKIALLELFVPPPLSNRLRAVPDSWLIEPEVRNVVIVFAEVMNVHSRDIELGTTLAQRFLAAARRFGGAILKGDLAERGHRVMAVFGLHAPSDIDGERAVMASLEFLAGSTPDVIDLEEPIELKVGIHRGDVYYGAIGSPRRYDITLVGDAVNVAARATAAAPAYGLVVTHELLADLRSDFEVSSLGPVMTKGKSRPLHLFQVHGARNLQARYLQKRRRSRRQAGRQVEMLELFEIVDSARGGRGRLVAIAGEHGVGKSFLLSHIIDRWLDGAGQPGEGAPIGMMGRCEFNARNEALAPIISMFRSFLGLVGEESEDETRRIIGERIGDYQLDEHGPVLLDYLVRANRGPITGESGAYWERVTAALMRFLSERIARQPVLYILEDLHHADSYTLALIRRLMLFSRDAAFLLVATYRPVEEVAFLGALTREYRLGNLGLRDAAQAVALYFDVASVDDAVASFLWERTRGNPGQLIELARFLRDRGLLRVEDDEVVIGKQGLQFVSELIPPNMSQFALARIELLGERERRLLRVASAIGQRFERELLGQVAAGRHLRPEEIDTGVLRLIDDGIISPELGRRPAFRFREDITRAVAYSTIPKSERKRYHDRIASALASLPPDQLERNSVNLARHYEKAERFTDAEHWYRQAIELAARARMDSEVCHLAERWQEVVERSRSAGPPSDVRARMAVRRFVSTARARGPAKAEAVADEVLAEHGLHMTDEDRARFALHYGASLIAVGRREDGCARLREAHDGATDRELRADAALRLGRAFHGIDREAENRWLQACAAELDDMGSEVGQRFDLARACVLAADGDLDDARILNGRIRDDARRLDRLSVAAVAANNLADCDLQSGNVEEALRGFEESAAMSRALGNATFPAIDALNLGICHVLLGRPTEGRRHLERALGQAEELGGAAIRYEAMIYLGLALALTDNLHDGEARAEEGRRLAAGDGNQPVTLAGDLSLLHIALIEGRRPTIAARLAACEAQAERVGKPVPLAARQLLALRARARGLGADPT